MSTMTTSATTSTTQSVSLSPWRSIGLWMVGFLIVYILLNAVRAAINPVDFAAYYGLPLRDVQSTDFVFVYGLRALFLGLFPLAMLLRRQYTVLGLFALIGIVMPLGDALLVARAGAGTGVIIRHLLVAVFLVATWYFVQRWAKRAQG